MRRRGLLARLGRHRSFVSPLRNRPPVLMMAAGHPHLNQNNRHQWAGGVAMPKLADPSVGESELSAEISAKEIRGNRCPGGCQTTTVGGGRRERQTMTETQTISERISRADCQNQMVCKPPQEHLDRSDQTQLVRSRGRPRRQPDGTQMLKSLRPMRHGEDLEETWR